MAKRKDNQPAAAGRRLEHNRGKSKAELRDERRHRSVRKQRIKRGIIYAGTSTLALLLVLGIVLPQTLGGGSSLTLRTEAERNSAVGEIPLPSETSGTQPPHPDKYSIRPTPVRSEHFGRPERGRPLEYNSDGSR